MKDVTPSRLKSEHNSSTYNVTPAARELLDLYAERYRLQVIDESRRIQGGGSDAIRLRSVQAALRTSTTGPGDREAPADISVRGLIVPAVIFVAITVTGLTFLLFDTGPMYFWKIIASTLAATGAGLSGALLWSTTRTLRTLRSNSRGTFVSLFLRDIDALEASAREIAAPILEADAETMSLSEVLSTLETSGIWQSSDSAIFRGLLKIRNQIVHEAKLTVDPQLLTESVSTVRRLFESLHNNRPEVVDRAPINKALRFEQEVGEALLRIIGEGSVTKAPESGYDYLIESDSDLIHVDIKYRTNGQLKLSDIMPSIDRTRSNARGPGLLIITNVNLSANVADSKVLTNARGRRIEIVTWTGPEDDAALDTSLAQLSKDIAIPASRAAKFEIYTDAKGQYRFRLKARNGEILAVSDGYNTKSGVIKSVNAVKGVALSAESVDRT